MNSCFLICTFVMNMSTTIFLNPFFSRCDVKSPTPIQPQPDDALPQKNREHNERSTRIPVWVGHCTTNTDIQKSLENIGNVFYCRGTPSYQIHDLGGMGEYMQNRAGNAAP